MIDVNLYYYGSSCAVYLWTTYCWEGWRTRMSWHHYGSNRQGRLKAQQVDKRRINTKAQRTSEEKHLLTRARGRMFLSLSTSALSLEGTTRAGKQAEQIKWATTLDAATYPPALSLSNELDLYRIDVPCIIRCCVMSWRLWRKLKNSKQTEVHKH